MTPKTAAGLSRGRRQTISPRSSAQRTSISSRRSASRYSACKPAMMRARSSTERPAPVFPYSAPSSAVALDTIASGQRINQNASSSSPERPPSKNPFRFGYSCPLEYLAKRLSPSHACLVAGTNESHVLALQTRGLGEMSALRGRPGGGLARGALPPGLIGALKHAPTISRLGRDRLRQFAIAQVLFNPDKHEA